MFEIPSRGTPVRVPSTSIFSSVVISDSRLAMRLSTARFGSLNGYCGCCAKAGTSPAANTAANAEKRAARYFFAISGIRFHFVFCRAWPELPLERTKAITCRTRCEGDARADLVRLQTNEPPETKRIARCPQATDSRPMPAAPPNFSVSAPPGQTSTDGGCRFAYWPLEVP